MSTNFTDLDNSFMEHAIDLAREALAQNEVPVGALAVQNGTIIAKFSNSGSKSNPLAHAEMKIMNYLFENGFGRNLGSITIYVTLEPCSMCTGAMVIAKLGRLVYGAPDPKSGAAGSLYNLTNDPRLNHSIVTKGHLLKTEAAELLKRYFHNKRNHDKP